MFWLLELDLVSLKGSSVFSSRFWRVQYGFSMPLSSPSSFSGVGGVYIQSGFKVALSAYLQCCQPPTCPWDHCWCFCSPVLPCTAGRNLLGSCLCGSFCVVVTCVHPSALEFPLRIMELVCTCLSSRGPPSRLRGLCALVSVPKVHLLCRGACVHLFHLTAYTLSHRGLFVLLSAVPGGLCTLPKFVYLPSIGTPVPPFRQQIVTLGYLGLAPVWQGLCVLSGFVCCPTLGSLSPLSV